MKRSLILLYSLWGIASAETITYDDHIQDLFGSHCSKCHNEDKKKGGLNLMTYTGMMAGGSSGASVVPGNAKDSLLYLTMTHEEEPTMPPKRDKLPKKDLDLVMNFINQGLKETSSSKALIAKKETLLDLSGDAGSNQKGPGVMPKVVHTKDTNLSVRANSTIALAHSPRSPLVAIGGLEQVLLYNSEDGQIQGVWSFKEGTIRDLRFTPNGKVLVASGGQDGASGRIVAWDVEKTNRILEVGKEFETLMAASLSSDLQFYASSAASSSFKIASVTDKNDTETIKKHTNWLTSISYSPDGILLATGDRDGGLYVWESHSKQRLYSLTDHKKKITKLSWKHDSNLLLSASEDGQIIIWNMMNGRKLKSWNAHKEGVLSVDISIKGQVATSGRDKLVKVWDANGKLLKTIKDFPDLPLSVKFNHDGKKLMTGDWLGHVKSWNVNDGKEYKSYASFYSSPIQTNKPKVTKKAEPLIATKVEQKKEAVKPEAKLAPKNMAKPKATQTVAKAKPAPKNMAKPKAIQTVAKAKPAPKNMAKPKAAQTVAKAKPAPKNMAKPKPTQTVAKAKPAPKNMAKPKPTQTVAKAKPAPKTMAKPKPTQTVAKAKPAPKNMAKPKAAQTVAKAKPKATQTVAKAKPAPKNMAKSKATQTVAKAKPAPKNMEKAKPEAKPVTNSKPKTVAKAKPAPKTKDQKISPEVKKAPTVPVKQTKPNSDKKVNHKKA